MLQDFLDKRKAEGALRSLQVHPGLIDFCSNDYLGLSRSPELLELVNRSWERLCAEGQAASGSGGSRLLAGNTVYAEELEKKIAAFHHAEAALLFNSGYDANIGFFSSVPRRGDTILYDELIHASVRDGIRLSHAQAYNFRHNDLAHLEERLAKTSGTVYVAVESVYSMDGDEAPLREMAALCARCNANLVVDEAHSGGVLGPQGRGMTVALGLEAQVFARLFTFGKALGCHGAAVTGSAVLRAYLINFARSFIYTTALPLHSLVAIDCAYRFVAEQDAARQLLAQHVTLFRTRMQALGFTLTPSGGPIQCVLQSGNAQVRLLAEQVRRAGYDVRPILSPTVPEGKERIRVCLHAFHPQSEITTLCEAFGKAKDFLAEQPE